MAPPGSETRSTDTYLARSGAIELGKWIQTGIGIGLLAVVIWWIDLDPAELLKSIEGADLALLTLLIPVLVINRIIMSGKWNLLLRAVDIHISWWESLRIYLIAAFAGMFLPPTFGGDAVRATILTRGKHSGAAVVSSILVERLVGVGSLLFMVLIGLAVLAMHFPPIASEPDFRVRSLILFTVGAGSVLVGGLVLSLRRSIGDRVILELDQRSGRRYIGKPCRLLSKLYRSYTKYRGREGLLSWFFFLSCVESISSVLTVFVVAKAIHVDVSFIYFLAFMPIVFLLIRMPISFDGLGIWEGSITSFLILQSVDEQVALSVALLSHFALFVSALPGGALLVLHGGVETVRKRPSEGA
jgi:uncharacterized protein (TIRG00374 family)